MCRWHMHNRTRVPYKILRVVSCFSPPFYGDGGTIGQASSRRQTSWHEASQLSLHIVVYGDTTARLEQISADDPNRRSNAGRTLSMPFLEPFFNKNDVHRSVSSSSTISMLHPPTACMHAPRLHRNVVHQHTNSYPRYHHHHSPSPLSLPFIAKYIIKNVFLLCTN